jgi:hypothetical protein
MAMPTKTARLKPALLLYLLGMVALHGLLAWELRREVRNGYSDFAIFYSAGKIVGQGLGGHLYDSDLQFRVQQEFAPLVHIRQGPLPYNHPPFEALVFVPFAKIPYFAAYLLWDFISLVMLGVLPCVLRPNVPLCSRLPVSLCLLAALAYFPIFIGLLQGQDVIVLLLLFGLTYAALKKNAEFTAGCCLGLGLFRFHLVFPFVLILLLLQKKWRVLSGFVSVAVGLGLISLAVVGWEGILAYPGYVLHLEAIGGHGSIVPANMPNLRGLVGILLAGRASPTISNGVIAVLSLGLLLLVSAKWRICATDPTFDLGFSLFSVVTVLVSYHAYAYDLSLLFLPVLLLVGELSEKAWSRDWSRIAVLSSICLLFFTPLQMILWLRFGALSLLALILLVLAWGIDCEIRAQRVGCLRSCDGF